MVFPMNQGSIPFLYAEVILPLPFDHSFDYLCPPELSIEKGNIVHVPFGPKKLFGVVETLKETSFTPSSKLKTILHKIEWCTFLEKDINFIRWMAAYTMAPTGMVLKMALSIPTAFDPERPTFVYHLAPTIHSQKLTEKQALVASWLQEHPGLFARIDIQKGAKVSAAVIQGMIAKGLLQPSCIDTSVCLPDPDFRHLVYSKAQHAVANTLADMARQGTYKTLLVDGVTGSGKTEVYFEALAECLRKGQQAVVLLPEISLTPQWLDRFEKRFGTLPTQWHSQMSSSTRRKTWRQIVKGEARVIVGARSALMLPYPKLGMIIVDEEHDSSYKQEEGVIYHARDMAVAKAYHLNIPIVLASATPSLDSYVNAQEGKYEHQKLTERHGDAKLPTLELIDRRHLSKEKTGLQWIAPPLAKALQETVQEGEQALLFLNRRGYAPLTLCRSCGERLQCPNCTAWLVEHKTIDRLQCHHCGFMVKKPPHCFSCGEEDSFVPCGPGVERVAEEVKIYLPEARQLIMASDAFEDTSSLSEAIHEIQKGLVDIIIGTQIMAKGHHFPHLTLVGVIDADLGLSGGDLRACEKTFQLLQQVAGRCGRSSRPGHVFLQTYYPDHPVMQALVSHEKEKFLQEEMRLRRAADMPPYSRLAALIFSSKDATLVEKWVKAFRKQAPFVPGIEILGPTQAPLAVLRRYHRWRFLVKAPKNYPLQKYIRSWLSTTNPPRSIKFQIDIDPIGFM